MVKRVHMTHFVFFVQLGGEGDEGLPTGEYSLYIRCRDDLSSPERLNIHLVEGVSMRSRAGARGLLSSLAARAPLTSTTTWRSRR